MNLITKEQLITKKQKSGLAIMATGYSINSITDEQWRCIHEQYDMFGINWFCKSLVPTTWYLVREQACKPLRQCKEQGYTVDNFIDLMRHYEWSCKIIKHPGYRDDHYHYHENIDQFDGDGMIFKEPPRARYADRFVDDIFEVGIHHGKCTIYEPLHFAVQLGYEKILFCGVDLYDNRYFYFDYNETLEQLKGIGRTCASEHLTANNTITLLETFKESFPHILLAVHNPQSRIASVVPVWEGA